MGAGPVLWAHGRGRVVWAGPVLWADGREVVWAGWTLEWAVSGLSAHEPPLGGWGVESGLVVHRGVERGRGRGLWALRGVWA